MDKPLVRSWLSNTAKRKLYNLGSTALARRVAEKTGCEVMTKDMTMQNGTSSVYG